MKKKNFRFLLSLLLMTIAWTSAWGAEKNYRVIYDHYLEVNGQKAGYTITNRNIIGDYYNTQITSITSNDDEIILKTSSEGTPTALTSDNINNYIKARPLEGYSTTIYVNDNAGGEIVIKYTYNGDQSNIITWHDDVFEYSTYFVKASCSEKLMPEGEVAVRLYLGETSVISDTVAYSSNKNGKGDYLYTSSSTYPTFANDDDGDGADGDFQGYGYYVYNNYWRQGNTSGSATYTYLGQLDIDNDARLTGHSTEDYFFLRKHLVKTPKEENTKNVRVPETVTYNGKTYKVTAIQKFGFTYKANAQENLTYCPSPDFNSQHTPTDGTSQTIHGNINDHRNYILEGVSFGDNSNIEEIGDYAFISCEALGKSENLEGKLEIKIPWKCKYLGVGAFMSCKNLPKVTFQECPEFNSEEFGKTRLEQIENWTFWNCTGIKNMYISDGVTRIEGLPSGAPLQYLVQLTNIRLPNTLKYVGPHFLCSATSLQEVTIPASVTYIDGACFHGCESLKKVNLLGSPADIQATYGGSNDSRTFGENKTFCGSHVNDCEFFVRADYLEDYKNHPTWKEIDKNGEWIGSAGYWTSYGNSLNIFPTTEREFDQDKWVTVIFPQRVGFDEGIGVIDRYESFGGKADGIDNAGPIDGKTWVAELTQVNQSYETLDGKTYNVYHLTFTEVEGTSVPSRKPLMIKPAKPTKYIMYDAADQAQEGFTLDMTDEHRLNVKSEDSEDVVTMKGKYIREPLNQYDFIFKVGEKGEDGKYTYSFRKLVDGKAYAGACKCWWTVYHAGVPSSTALVNSMKDFVDPTSINEAIDENSMFVLDAIYDIQGRKIKVNQSELPAGLFIINGKKVLVK